MKIKILFFLFAFFVSTQGTFAQERSAKESQNIIKTNTFALLVGMYNVAYERKFSDSFSSSVVLSYWDAKIREFLGNDESYYDGFFITPEIRWYPFKKSLSAMYVASYVRYSYIEERCYEYYGGFFFDSDREGEYQSSYENTFNNYGAGLLLGKQWILKCAVVIDIYAGVHYNLSDYKTNRPDNYTLDDFEGYRPRLGFSLGYAF